MKKAIKLLRRLKSRLKVNLEDPKDSEAFDKRMKKVNRARVVNQIGLGGPVFKSRESETEV
jgi:hypothetical protein